MSHRIDRTPSTDQQDTDVISAVPADPEPVPARETAPMPVVNFERYFRPEPAPPPAPAPEPSERPLSHRRERSPHVAGALCAAVVVVLIAAAGSLLLSQGGGTAREQVPPSASIAASLPPVEISVVPKTPHPPRRTTPRRIVPAVPVPTRTSPRPTVTPSPTPSAPVSPSPKPPRPTQTLTPTHSPTAVTGTPTAPGVSGVAYISKETP